MASLEHSLFEKLPPWNQAEILAKKGRTLTQRQHLDCTVTLVALENELLEVWSRRGVQIIGTFKAAANPMDIYEPYLVGMALPQG